MFHALLYTIINRRTYNRFISVPNSYKKLHVLYERSVFRNAIFWTLWLLERIIAKSPFLQVLCSEQRIYGLKFKKRPLFDKGF